MVEHDWAVRIETYRFDTVAVKVKRQWIATHPLRLRKQVAYQVPDVCQHRPIGRTQYQCGQAKRGAQRDHERIERQGSGGADDGGRPRQRFDRGVLNSIEV